MCGARKYVIFFSAARHRLGGWECRRGWSREVRTRRKQGSEREKGEGRAQEGRRGGRVAHAPGREAGEGTRAALGRQSLGEAGSDKSMAVR